MKTNKLTTRRPSTSLDFQSAGLSTKQSASID